jgi:hypothetical protein
MRSQASFQSDWRASPGYNANGPQVPKVMRLASNGISFLESGSGCFYPSRNIRSALAQFFSEVRIAFVPVTTIRG